jgi:hypothetical protein
VDRETFETAQALLGWRNIKQEKRCRNTEYLLTGFCSGRTATRLSPQELTHKGRNAYRAGYSGQNVFAAYSC